MILNEKTRVFVSGCGGMLGDAVYKYLSSRCVVLATDIDTKEEPWINYGDVRDYQKIYKIVRYFSPDLIVNLAALTDLELCEKDPENTWKTNALGAENMALISQNLNVPHIYISTAGIFDGKQEYYNDFDTPNPLSMYAKAKYYGETVVQKMLTKYFIFRAGWMMGGGPEKDKKFINKLYKQIRAGSNEIFVVNDKYGTPTYTNNFAENMFNVAQSDMYGLYNMVCGGSCTRYQVAKKFIEFLELENKVKITEVDSEYFKKDYSAPRPESEKLVNLKLTSRGLNIMKNWEVCLKEYVGEYYVTKK